jgi:hypothetical protein
MMKRLQNDYCLAEKKEVPNLLEDFKKLNLLQFDSYSPGSDQNHDLVTTVSPSQTAEIGARRSRRTTV